ncbi:MAG: rhodanese-like domain-containing protein [Rhodospirillales bacterium]|nr:rhodanese-like domain-containing protein [Rhodospirillales bacterium]
MEALAQTPPQIPNSAPTAATTAVPTPVPGGAAGDAAPPAPAPFDPVLFAALMVSMFLIMRYVPRLMAGVPFVDPGVLKRFMDDGKDHLVIDVRGEGEFNGRMGHVPGSLNLPLPELRRRLAELGDALNPYKSAQVFIICRTSNRSANAARVLKKAGFTNLAVVTGGMARWKRAKLPVEGQG